MTDTGPIIDPWSALDHKAGMGPNATSGIDAAPGYLDDDQKRRWNAYARYRAMLGGVGRTYLIPDPTLDTPLADTWREYGDPYVIVATQAAAVLGEDPLIVVGDAEDPLPDRPDIPPEPAPPNLEDTSPEARALLTGAHAQVLATWATQAEGVIAAWVERAEARPRLLARQAWLRDWAYAEGFWAKVTENEAENIVPLGSGVYVFGWSADKNRPTCEIYEPEAYYPVLDERDPNTFPNKVHLAWQFTRTAEDGTETEMVRRITYELVPLEDAPPGPGTARPRYLTAEDTHTHTCLLSDGVWLAADFEKVTDILEGAEWATTIDAAGNEVELRQWPTGLDFIPVVHVPNTLASVHHFGRSALSPVVQLLDDIAGNDTDTAQAAGWAGDPPLAIRGLQPGQTTVNVSRGKSFAVAENGGVDTIPMAENLGRLMERTSELLKRLSVNSRTPEGLLGRVDPSEVPSGIALTLSFTAFSQLIKGMRLARAMPYSLALRFVQRIAIQAQDPTLDGTEVEPAEIQFGTFMPQDLAGMATVLGSLRSSGLLSQETGVQMAREAGVPVEDVPAEVASIRAGQAEVAEAITQATENPRYGAEWLGIEDWEPADGVDPDAPPAVPPIDLNLG